MKKHLIISYIIFFTCLNSCNDINNNRKHNESDVDSFLITQKKSNYERVYDSLENIKLDTTTLIGKREKINNEFLLENGLVAPDYDTLFDLTYDGYKDYILGYYGKSGSGIKNRVKVFFFDPSLNSYIYNEQLSNLHNLTFYIRQNKITGFYIGNGGGGGEKLEWIKNKWITTKEFEVDFDYNNREKTEWKIKYPLKNKAEVIIRPFQMIPPEEILETNIKI